MAVEIKEFGPEDGRKAFYLHEVLKKIKIPHHSWPPSRKLKRQAKYLQRTVYTLKAKMSTAMSFL